MGRLGNSFVRFPHRCVIYTITDVTPFSEGTRVVVWEGRCRKESNTSVRTFKGADGVYKSDYRVQLGSLKGGSLPGDANAAYDGVEGKECGAVVSGIVAGLLMDVVDPQGNTEGLMVSEAYTGNLGTTVYCNTPKN